MTIPDHRLPTQTPDDRNFQELQERVSHLAVEVFHLTTEVEELRKRVGPSRDPVASDSQSSQPKEQAVPSLPRFEVGPSTESVEFDLESFRPESLSPLPVSGVEEHEPAVEPISQTPTRDTSARPGHPLLPNGKTAAQLGGAVAIVTLLLVGLLRGGDGSNLAGESTRATTPLVDQVLTASVPSSAPQVQGMVDISRQGAGLGQPGQRDPVVSEI